MQLINYRESLIALDSWDLIWALKCLVSFFIYLKAYPNTREMSFLL